jgi:tripartite-type tricarboxylate transporter receptor subunit TctC
MLPQIPTVIEAGFPGFTAANWWGMAAPNATPKDIIETVRQALAQALGDPALADRFTAMGLLRPQQTREDFVISLSAQAALWSQIIARGQIVIE